jgi:glycopeptide antibiotics resistance protein
MGVAMRPRHNKNTSKTEGRVLLLAYLGFISYFAFLSRIAGRQRLQINRYNLIPFRSIRLYFSAAENTGMASFIINILGNLIVFMPVGLFVPYFLENVKGLKGTFRVGLIGFFFSLWVETMQYVFSVGVFDVDDLILNTIGALLGLLIYIKIKPSP